MRKSRLDRIERRLKATKTSEPDSSLTRIELWKQVLRGERPRPSYHTNVERRDKLCEMIARIELEMEIPQELQENFEKEIEHTREWLEVIAEMEGKDIEPTREQLEELTLEDLLDIPADWDFQVVMKRFKEKYEKS